MKTKPIKYLLTSFLIISLASCGENKPEVENKDISIIYTTDVHCGLTTPPGYSSLASYRDELAKTNYVTLLDSGDYLQGDLAGAISDGKYLVDIMNEVGYDIVTLGNHEFDFGVDTLATRLNELNSEVTSCNFSYIGNKKNKFDFIKPYIIKEYGDKKIGYIGVTTPSTLTESDPSNFLEDGKVAYTFGADTPDHFYSIVQSNIDLAKADGADYIILLSHLGSYENYSPYSSIDVLSHTSGVTAFLDGHAHADLPWTTYKNKDSVDTLLVDTGYKLNEFAALTITKKGEVKTDFIKEYEGKSAKVDAKIKEVQEKCDEVGKRVVANIDIDLSIFDSDGIRMIRSREMPFGNLVADAYREIAEVDIGFINGGGVRANLTKGDVTYAQIRAVHPFGNLLLKKRVSGADILDYLEFATRLTQSEYKKDGKAYGENGEFSHVSGLRFTVDTSIENHVVTDASGNFVKVDGERRVKDVQVLVDGNYVDFDATKDYSVASNDFILANGGGGANMFMDDPIIPSSTMVDYEVLIKYISETLEGHLSEKYSSTEGRINII